VKVAAAARGDELISGVRREDLAVLVSTLHISTITSQGMHGKCILCTTKIFCHGRQQCAAHKALGLRLARGCIISASGQRLCRSTSGQATTAVVQQSPSSRCRVLPLSTRLVMSILLRCLRQGRASLNFRIHQYIVKVFSGNCPPPLHLMLYIPTT